MRKKYFELFFVLLLVLTLLSCGDRGGSGTSKDKPGSNVVKTEKIKTKAGLVTYRVHVDSSTGAMEFTQIKTKARRRSYKWAIDESTVAVSGAALWDSANKLLIGHVTFINNDPLNVLYDVEARINWISNDNVLVYLPDTDVVE